MNWLRKVGLHYFLLVALVVSCVPGDISSVMPAPTVASQALHELPADQVSLIRNVCSGGTIPGTAPHNSGKGPHPIFIIPSDLSEQDYYSVSIPTSWLPTSLETLELVACLGESQEDVIQSCAYTGGPGIQRIQYTRELRVVEATSGEIIYEEIVRGGHPSPCPDVAPVEMVTQPGSSITPEDLLENLSSIVEEGRLPKVTLSGETGYLRDVAWSPDDTKITAVNEFGVLFVWDVLNNSRFFMEELHTGNADSVDWSPDGNWIASSGYDGRVILVDAHSYEARILSEFGEYVWIESIAWSPDGAYLFATSQPMTLWDPRTWISRTVDTDPSRHPAAIWSPSGDQVAVASWENVLRLDVATGQWLDPIQGNPGSILVSLAWSPDAQMIAAGADDNSIVIWDLNSGAIIKTLTGHQSAVDSLAWSPDGTRLASSSTWDGTVYIWDMPGGNQIGSTAFTTVDGLDWSSDGQTLAIGAGRDVVIWLVP